MLLSKLEVRNYRSIRSQVDEDAIAFSGVDCLVGKNNAGKSNVLKAIQYLLGEESHDRELHWNRDPNLEIEVRGYFRVSDSDFQLLEIENKREALRECVLDDGTLGICRRSSQSDLELLRYLPEEERLWHTSFAHFHTQCWDGREDNNDFEGKMREQFPELVSYLEEGKESNKGEWPNAYERFLSDRPEDVTFVLKPGPFPTGISADARNMLPRLIPVPAVKEVSDATKTTGRAELGSLLNEVYGEVREDLDSAIEEATRSVYRQLNIVPDERGGQIDNRIHGVKAIEEQVSRYVAETFPSVSVSLEFPAPESEVMFSNARVWVKEEGLDERILVENSGEGVKRILIFSLFRTLADLRAGELSLTEEDGEGSEDGEVRASRRNLMILYEEAELFLHPGLQRKLLSAFSALHQSGEQVIFSTHSPFMIDQFHLESISLVRKGLGASTTVDDLMSSFGELDERDQNALTQVQNISAYVFAERVVLVEGLSERIVLGKLAKALDEEWDFVGSGIPVLSVHGKGRLPLFHGFLESIGIMPHMMLDLDCVADVLPRIVEGEEVIELRDHLITECRSLAESGEIDVTVNSNFVNDLVSKYDWREIFDKLEDLAEQLASDEDPGEEEIGALQRLTQKRHKDAWLEALSSDHSDVVELRVNLVEMLLNQGILLLSGEIEDYYPDAAGHKVKSALQFDPAGYSHEELKSQFTVVPNSEREDMIIFLERVFG